MRLPVIIINDCWEYIIEVEVEGGNAKLILTLISY